MPDTYLLFAGFEHQEEQGDLEFFRGTYGTLEEARAAFFHMQEAFEGLAEPLTWGRIASYDGERRLSVEAVFAAYGDEEFPVWQVPLPGGVR